MPALSFRSDASILPPQAAPLLGRVHSGCQPASGVRRLTSSAPAPRYGFAVVFMDREGRLASLRRWSPSLRRRARVRSRRCSAPEPPGPARQTAFPVTLRFAPRPVVLADSQMPAAPGEPAPAPVRLPAPQAFLFCIGPPSDAVKASCLRTI